MNISREKVIVAALLLAVSALLLYDITNPLAFLHNLAFLGLLGGVFWLTAFHWMADLQHHATSPKSWGTLVALLITGWLAVSVSYVVYVESLAGNPVLFEYFFYPMVAQKSLEAVIPGLALGIGYGYIRKLITTKNKQQLQRVGLGVLGTFTVAGVLFAVMYAKDLGYDGTERIQFLDRDQQITSLEALLDKPALRGQKVYIDLWYSSCSPCIKAFRGMLPAQKLFRKSGIITLYLGRETSHSNSKQRWINTIKDFALDGMHVYMSDELEADIYEQVGQYVDRHFGYPHYLIVNEKGEVVNWDAPGVLDLAELEKAVAQLNTNE